MGKRCIAIVSPGDMGHAVGALLAERGFRVVSALAARSELTRTRAERAGIEDVGDLDGVVTAAEGILAILPPAEAEPLAGRVAEAMTRIGRTLSTNVSQCLRKSCRKLCGTSLIGASSAPM